MGLLFVFQGDDNAAGPHFDLSRASYNALAAGARRVKGGFPLFRRLSDFYQDTSFDQDELAPLVDELIELRGVEPNTVDGLVSLAQAASDAGLGLLVIAD